MKIVFTASTISTRFLSVLIVLYILMPGAILYSTDVIEEIGALAAAAAGTTASLPFILIFSFLLYKIRKQKIIITADSLRYRSSSADSIIPWNRVTYYRYDHISIPNPAFGIVQKYTLYEIGNDNARARFNVRRPLFGSDDVLDHTPIKVLEKKSFRFDTYGVSLTLKKAEQLTGWITSSTNLQPERIRGIF